MDAWKRASERYLFYKLEHASSPPEESQVYNELHERFRRYFRQKINIKGWRILEQEQFQDEIISETIFRVLKTNAEFKGNSIQFRKLIQKVLLSVCAKVLREEFEFVYASLDDDLSQKSTEDNTCALLDILSTALFPGVQQIHPDWLEQNDCYAPHNPEQLISDEERSQYLERSRGKLSKSCQTLLYQADELELSLVEIARASKKEYGAIRTELSRCRHRLLRQIIQGFNQHDETQSAQIVQTIQTLPEPQKVILQAWWDGAVNWKRLGMQLSHPVSQAQTKKIFAEGILKLIQHLDL